MRTETEGIVLREVKATGGRTMLLMFSQKYGKISVGVGPEEKRSKSKSSLATKPFTYGRYELYKGREIYNLSGSEVIRTFFDFGSDLDKYVACSYALELTEKLLQEDVAEPRVFSLLLDFFNSMEKRTKSFDTLLIAYEIKLLGALGHDISLGNCMICGENNPNWFSVPEAGMICEDCAKKITENTLDRGAYRLIYKPKFDIVNTIKYFKEKPMSGFDKIALEKDSAKELQSIIRDFFSYHLDLGLLKSESLL